MSMKAPTFDDTRYFIPMKAPTFDDTNNCDYHPKPQRPLVKDITVKEPNVKKEEKQKHPLDFNSNELSNTPFQPGQKSWLDIAVNNLFDYLCDNSFIYFEYEDGSIKRVPVAKRGNKAYAYREQDRLQNIQWAIDNLVKTKEIDSDHIETNTIFVTLTCKYDPSSLTSIENSWHNVKNELPKFIKKFRNKKSIKKFGNLTHYIVGFEAYENGGCHAHIAMIFDKPIFCTKMYSEAEKKDVWRVPDENRDLIKKNWNWNVDVRGSDTAAIAGYLTKELGKANHVEDALKRWMDRRKTGKLLVTKEEIEQYKSDVKKIWAYFLAIKLKMRLLHVSKSIPRLDKNENKSQKEDEQENTKEQKPKPKVVKILFFRRYLGRYLVYKRGFGISSGWVKPDDEDYLAVKGVFDGINVPSGTIEFKSEEEYYSYLAGMKKKKAENKE